MPGKLASDYYNQNIIYGNCFSDFKIRKSRHITYLTIFKIRKGWAGEASRILKSENQVGQHRSGFEAPQMLPQTLFGILQSKQDFAHMIFGLENPKCCFADGLGFCLLFPAGRHHRDDDHHGEHGPQGCLGPCSQAPLRRAGALL
jgi:hypothetical protein